MVLEEILKRRSIRSYLPTPVEAEKLDRIMEAARWAPTTRNCQQWKIIMITDPKLKNDLVDAAAPHQPFLKEAPILLVACGMEIEYIMKCGHHAYLVNVSIVLDHLSLQAQREGLGTCWIGSYDETEVKKLLHIPDNVRVVQLMSLGYPNQSPNPPLRKPTSEFFCTNRWQ